jgi:hypothetical protein
MEIYTALYRDDSFLLSHDTVLGNFTSYTKAFNVSQSFKNKSLEEDKNLKINLRIIKSFLKVHKGSESCLKI